MKYKNIVKGQFISRENRFVATVKIGDKTEICHVKNTGRCRELFITGASVYLEDFSGRMGNRKLQYDIIAVEKGDIFINIDSQAPNKVVHEALNDGRIQLRGMGQLSEIRPEKFFGNSRFDFYVRDKEGREGFVEVKGVTLENDGIVSFPDAPTERGIKHLKELSSAVEAGFNGYVIFIIQMEGVRYFTPNDTCHHAFGEALREAERCGVNILAYECRALTDTLEISRVVATQL